MINDIMDNKYQKSNSEYRIKNIQLRINAIWYDMIIMFSLLMLTILVFKSGNVITSIICLIAFLIIAIICQIFEAKENTRIKNGS
jgi:predicted CDP-diglyceride synthetase/phosphatidate cytidylyltransferase